MQFFLLSTSPPLPSPSQRRARSSPPEQLRRASLTLSGPEQPRHPTQPRHMKGPTSAPQRVQTRPVQSEGMLEQEAAPETLQHYSVDVTVTISQEVPGCKEQCH